MVPSTAHRPAFPLRALFHHCLLRPGLRKKNPLLSTSTTPAFHLAARTPGAFLRAAFASLCQTKPNGGGLFFVGPLARSSDGQELGWKEQFTKELSVSKDKRWGSEPGWGRAREVLQFFFFFQAESTSEREGRNGRGLFRLHGQFWFRGNIHCFWKKKKKKTLNELLLLFLSPLTNVSFSSQAKTSWSLR